MAEPVEFTDFCSPAYKLETVNSACSEMINLYPELVEQGPRSGRFRLRSIPGLTPFANLGNYPVSALFSVDGGNRLFAVSNGTFYEVLSSGTNIPYTGTMAGTDHPVLLSANGSQLVAASGGQLYLIQGGLPGTVTPLYFIDTDTGLPDPTQPITAGSVDFMDDYFICALANTKQIFVSNLAPAGGTWDPGDTAYKEGYADNIARVFVDNEQLWLFGFETLEIWSDTAGLFPFSRIPGALYKIGCSAPYSVAAAQGYRFWLWNNTFYGAYGQNPTRISDSGVEEDLKTYATTADCEGWCQISGAHVFYVAQFPTAQKTWVYDLATKCWHRRGFWSRGQWSQYRARVYAKAFGKEYVGDVISGNIYQLDPKSYVDAAATPLRRERVCPYICNSERMMRYSQLIVDMDTGVGLSGVPGFDPQIIMKYSDDRAKTWKNERQTSIGPAGETNTRVIFNNNGASRIGKTFSLVVTDEVPVVYNTAYLRLGQPVQGH